MKRAQLAAFISLAATVIVANNANEPVDPALVHYELGVDLVSQDRADEATRAFQDAIRISPGHSDSWFALARLADDRGHRVRAYVSYLRFLTLEPDQGRSAEASTRLWELLFQGVEPHKKAKKSTISIDPPRDDPDPWWDCSMMMSLEASLRKTKKASAMSDAEFFATSVKGLSLYLDNFVLEADVDPFWKTQIVHYLNDARESGHIEALGYFVQQSAGDTVVATWLRANGDAVMRFQDWNNDWRPATN